MINKNEEDFVVLEPGLFFWLYFDPFFVLWMQGLYLDDGHGSKKKTTAPLQFFVIAAHRWSYTLKAHLSKFPLVGYKDKVRAQSLKKDSSCTKISITKI